MLFHLMKKDLMKRKGINLILFLFITLATVFLSSSVNNIMIVTSAVDYYMEYANVPDVNVLINSEKEQERIANWIEGELERGSVSDVAYNTFVTLSDNAVVLRKANEQITIDSKGLSMYLSTLNVPYSIAYDLDAQPLDLQPGEIALSVTMMTRNNIEPGDTIDITLNDKTTSFVVKTAVKDAAFGNEMVGMTRLLVSEQDYKAFEKAEHKIGVFYIETPYVNDVTLRLNNQGFSSIINTVDKSMYAMMYAFDMILAGLLIVIGICLILIALLVLRFTLVFTMEEEYQEIGILKAIGLKNFNIKKLYLVKYLVLVSAGAMLGLLISVPVSQLMIDGVSKNMIMETSEANFGINILSAIMIVLLVLCFCYFCTHRLHRVSAVTAIRGGVNGERFSKRGIALTKRNHMPIPMYLGLQDILTHIRRYAVLIVTFCISFLLITIPLNTINTMNSDEMVRKFLLDPESTILLRNIETTEEGAFTSLPKLEEGMNRVQGELKEKGYDAQLTGVAIFFQRYAQEGDSNQRNLMTLQFIDKQHDYDEYSEGSRPLLENEIAFSESVMKANHWSIGDYVNVTVKGEQRSMIITGTYTDYMQLGNSARLNPIIDCSQEFLFDYWAIMVYIDSANSQEVIREELKADFPTYEWNSAQAMINQNVGGIKVALEQMLFPMTAMLCAVIMLITMLMEKLFIAREKGEIAMMKSIGFSYRAILLWQMSRMTFVVVTSMIISIPLSFLSNHVVLKPIFAIMGADVGIQVDPIQTYLLYPGVLLLGILLATFLAARGIRHINIREMNNLE